MSSQDKKRKGPQKKGPQRAPGRRATAETVEAVMVTDVVTVAPSATLAEAARTMERANVGMLPVLDGRQLRGVITDRDIVVRAIARDADLSNTRVEQCLTEEVI